MKLLGVNPADFRCESLLRSEQLTQLLGAPSRFIESTAVTPTGVAAPCTYQVQAAEQETWIFDIDCRPSMETRANALFEQYRRTSDDLVEAAAREPQPARAPGEGERARRKPERAFTVEVGAKALDHHGQGLLFIDDDAPCYVRVVGPAAAGRLALARHLATALTPATAPMSPRPALP